MQINIKEWEKKYPDLDKDKLLGFLSDASLKSIPIIDYEGYINQRIADEKVVDNSIEKNAKDLSEESKAQSSPELKDEVIPDPTFKDQINAFRPKPRNVVNEPRIPYDNPDLNDLGVQEQDDELEEKPEPVISKPEPPVRVRPAFMPNEMVTRTISYQEYDEIIKPFRPFLDDIRKDSGVLHKLASQMDGRYMPPYMQIKSYIINNPIKDPNNTTVLLQILSESNAKRLEQKYVNITQAVDITRTLAEQAWFSEAFNNYDIIAEKLFEDRRAMASLIFILENYCEQKQVSPFELSIPKKVLMDSVEQSFQNIKQLITNNVIKEMSSLRKDLEGEMFDVGKLVEKNMMLNSTQLQEAVTKVLWKVKTDVENTNMEDIKQSLLWILNKRTASYTLGGVATAILGMLLDDLERKLLETGFKLDNITHRTYTTQDLTTRLGYKSQSNVITSIKQLSDRKLVKIYTNRSISL